MWLERPVCSRASVQPVHSGLVASNRRSSAVRSDLIQESEATVTGLLLFFCHATKSIICHLRLIEANHAHCFWRLLTLTPNRLEHITRTARRFRDQQQVPVSVLRDAKADSGPVGSGHDTSSLRLQKASIQLQVWLYHHQDHQTLFTLRPSLSSTTHPSSLLALRLPTTHHSQWLFRTYMQSNSC